MKMRAGPSVSEAVVIYVPAKSELLVCEELSTPATIENIQGHWRKVKYKDKYGYMFDGFLSPVQTVAPNGPAVLSFKLAQLLVINRILAQDMSKLDSVLNYLTLVAKTNGYENIVGPPLPDRDSLFENNNAAKVAPKEEKEEPVKEVMQPVIEFKFITEAFNYCGDITTLDPGKIWYGIYRKGDQFFRERINLMVVRSKYSLGSGIEFDLKAEEDIQPLFLLSSSKLLQENWYVTQSSDFFLENPKTLFPGQLVELYGKDPVEAMSNVRIFATGNVTGVGICPEMTNYKIKVTGEMNNNLITQDITPFFEDFGSCGIPEIFWFGDLNSDEYPEIIFVSTSDLGYTFTFFVSDTRNKNVLYRKADQWSNHNCD